MKIKRYSLFPNFVSYHLIRNHEILIKITLSKNLIEIYKFKKRIAITMHDKSINKKYVERIMKKLLYLYS